MGVSRISCVNREAPFPSVLLSFFAQWDEIWISGGKKSLEPTRGKRDNRYGKSSYDITMSAIFLVLGYLFACLFLFQIDIRIYSVSRRYSMSSSDEKKGLSSKKSKNFRGCLVCTLQFTTRCPARCLNLYARFVHGIIALPESRHNRLS